jgi:uncharacterized protein (TIGR03084 family)
MSKGALALADVVADLSAEGVELDALVSSDGVDLATPTPAAGWTVAHQIGHLAWADQLTIEACRNPEGFDATLAAIAPDLVTLAASIEAGAAAGAALPETELLQRWRIGRAEVLMALGDVPSGTRLGWIGTSMGAGTMASARIMETWAHGLDIADALGITRTPTDRLRHVADLGVRTRDNGFRMHGLETPAEPFRVELTAPSGTGWVWGPADAAQTVTGPALDFALLVTQRRHRADVSLLAQGQQAEQWLTIAQAFAGPPGLGRTPLASTTAR